MSKNNNVNPGQYKTEGRERQGENIEHERQKQQLSQNAKNARGYRKPKKGKR